MFYISDNKDEFLKFPQKIYKDDPFYTTQKEDIPDEAKLFLVKEGENVLARCALIYNDGLKYNGAKTLQLGFFEAEDNLDAVKFLFDEIKKYAKKDYEYLIGPINGSTWKKYRVTLPSENSPFLLDNYNRPYYAKLFEEAGWEQISYYTSTIFDNLDVDYSKVDTFAQRLKEKNITIRNFKLEEFDEEIKRIYEISVKSFTKNFLYTPIEFEEFAKMYAPVKAFCKPEWIFFAENENNEPIAFLFCIDNLFDKNKKSIIAKTMARIPEPEYRGVGAYLLELMHKKAFDAGYDNIIHALMYETNVSAKILSDYARLYHEYKLYGVKL